MTTLCILAVVVVQALDLATTIRFSHEANFYEAVPWLRDADRKPILWLIALIKTLVCVLISYLLLQGFGTTFDLLITTICVVPTLYIGIRNIRLLQTK